MNQKIIHIFSTVPRVSSLLQKSLPIWKIINVIPQEHSESFMKTVEEYEVEQLKDAKFLICDTPLLAQMYTKLPNLEWAQLTSAGVESLVVNVQTSKIKPTFTVTRCAAFNQQMAEYTIGWMIHTIRGFDKTRQLQKDHIWRRNMPQFSTLAYCTVGILGVGEIGMAIARHLKLFDCKVVGFGRSEQSSRDSAVDEYWSGQKGELTKVLEQSDFIVNVLPSTSDTRGILGGDVLKSAKRGATFINIGRGDVISDEDVIKALDNEWISGAILDVFTAEPLPRSSPLWMHHKVTITPHDAAITTAENVANTFLTNLDTYTKNEPLKHVINWDQGY